MVYARYMPFLILYCMLNFYYLFIHSFIHSSDWSSPLFPITSVPLRLVYFRRARGRHHDGTRQYFVNRQKSNSGICFFFFAFMISLLLCIRF